MATENDQPPQHGQPPHQQLGKTSVEMLSLPRNHLIKWQMPLLSSSNTIKKALSRLKSFF